MTSSNTRDPGTDCLTRAEFVSLASEFLRGRIFSTAENHALADFFVRYAPLQRHVVEAGLRVAVEEKGFGRHLRFYLDAIRAARPGRRAV